MYGAGGESKAAFLTTAAVAMFVADHIHKVLVADHLLRRRFRRRMTIRKKYKKSSYRYESRTRTRGMLVSSAPTCAWSEQLVIRGRRGHRADNLGLLCRHDVPRSATLSAVGLQECAPASAYRVHIVLAACLCRASGCVRVLEASASVNRTNLDSEQQTQLASGPDVPALASGLRYDERLEETCGRKWGRREQELYGAKWVCGESGLFSTAHRRRLRWRGGRLDTEAD